MKKATICTCFVLLISNCYQSCFGQSQAAVVQPEFSEIISKFPSVRDIAISADGNEAYFTAQSYLGELSAIVTIRKVNGKWIEPAVVSFSGKYQDLEPFLAPGGMRLYFASNRPLEASAGKSKEDFDIWYSERKTPADDWSAPVNIGAPVNTKENEFYPSVSNSGNLYYTSDGIISKGKDDIFLSIVMNGKFQAPVSIGDSINTTGYEFNAFIAPDESFLIFTCYNREGGFGSGDLYISYNKSKDPTSGNWTAPKNLGKEINSAQMDYCPFVDIKTGTLYFTSKRTEFADNSDDNKDIMELLKEMNQYENGQSRLYKVSDFKFSK